MTSQFCQGVEKWLAKQQTEKQRDIPLRTLFNEKTVIDGMGNYNCTEFFEILVKEGPINFASPVSLMIDDVEMRKYILASLQKYVYNQRHWMVQKIQKCGFLSSIRHNEWWEDYWLRRQVPTYRGNDIKAYRIVTPLGKAPILLNY